MTIGGWILMTICVGGTTAFFFACVYLVLTRGPNSSEPKAEKSNRRHYE